jgi:hypothetical protein
MLDAEPYDGDRSAHISSGVSTPPRDLQRQRTDRVNTGVPRMTKILPPRSGLTAYSRQMPSCPRERNVRVCPVGSCSRSCS